VARKNAVSRDQRNGIEIQVLEWQIAAAAVILCGRDTYVVTATGSGKTMCFQLALFARPGIIIVISPLLALMDDQVSGAAQLGIKAVQISEKTIKEDPELINRVRDGEFQLVFLQPEFCHASNGQWHKMTGLKTKFVESVFSIVIDEAHLIHQWRIFRTRYGHLASLRHTFNQASYMLCSATMMGYTRRFINRTLNLGPNVSFIHRSVDRLNVYIAVKQIFEGTKDHRELYYLGPNSITHPAEIPETIVFIDSRPDTK
jgi:superfamily II DNA helicase RecQ